MLVVMRQGATEDDVHGVVRAVEARGFKDTIVRVGDVPVGGREFVVAAGPCAVESRGAAAVGADGLIVEVHHDPDTALSDGPQSITPDAFASRPRVPRVLIPA
jgi:3-deoxy-D-arabino-heptulosonate 7-phosphate (DAHP) synthase